MAASPAGAADRGRPGEAPDEAPGETLSSVFREARQHLRPAVSLAERARDAQGLYESLSNAHRRQLAVEEAAMQTRARIDLQLEIIPHRHRQLTGDIQRLFANLRHISAQIDSQLDRGVQEPVEDLDGNLFDPHHIARDLEAAAEGIATANGLLEAERRRLQQPEILDQMDRLHQRRAAQLDLARSDEERATMEEALKILGAQVDALWKAAEGDLTARDRHPGLARRPCP